MSIFDILAQVVGGASTDQHFDQVAAQAPTDVLGKGLGEAFRSDQTPPIGEMVA